MRAENRDGEGDCYQVNDGVKAVYSDSKKELTSLTVKNQGVEDDQFYTIALQGYHFNQSKAYLGISNEELLESGEVKVITTSAQEVLEEYLKNNQNISREIEGRLVYL